MYKNLLFPINSSSSSYDINQIKDFFNLNFVFKNERTTIFDNDDLRLCVDKNVVRAIVFDGDNHALIRKIKNYFWNTEDK